MSIASGFARCHTREKPRAVDRGRADLVFLPIADVPQLGLVTGTLSRAAHSVGSFAAVFLCVLYGFAAAHVREATRTAAIVFVLTLQLPLLLWAFVRQWRGRCSRLAPG